jgi:hypothetical protein
MTTIETVETLVALLSTKGVILETTERHNAVDFFIRIIGRKYDTRFHLSMMALGGSLHGCGGCIRYEPDKDADAHLVDYVLRSLREAGQHLDQCGVRFISLPTLYAQA